MAMNRVQQGIMNSVKSDVELPISITLPRAVDTEQVREDQKVLRKLVNEEFKKNQNLQRAIFFLEQKRVNDPTFGAKAKHKVVKVKNDEAKVNVKPEKPPIVILDSGEITNVDVREFMEYQKCKIDIKKNVKASANSDGVRDKLQSLNKVRLAFAKEIAYLKQIMTQYHRLSEDIERKGADEIFQVLQQIRLNILQFKQKITNIALGRKDSNAMKGRGGNLTGYGSGFNDVNNTDQIPSDSDYDDNQQQGDGLEMTDDGLLDSDDTL